jgi:hypothetical protein
MKRFLFSLWAAFAFIQFTFGIALSPPCFAQEWEFSVKPRGTLKVVDLRMPDVSVVVNYA